MMIEYKHSDIINLMQVCLWKRLEFSISLTALGKTLLNAGQLFLLALANNTFYNICK